MSVRKFEVRREGTVVLDVVDTPGPLRSTASPPPGASETKHAFLTATAYEPGAENELRDILLASDSTDSFVARLSQAGFEVTEVDDTPAT